MTTKPSSFLSHNSLSLILILCFLLSLLGQIVSGWKEHNQTLREHGVAPIQLRAYLSSGHFAQATFENWESEFLQMGMYVLLTVSLRQKGSSESKKMEGKEEVDREPDPSREGAPWAVRRGGLYLKFYKNSLSIAFVLLFALSFIAHFLGSLKTYNEEQALKGQQTKDPEEYIVSSRFWFESFQNWQSEFIAVTSIVLFSIFLRQKGSPQSKPVDAPNFETGD